MQEGRKRVKNKKSILDNVNSEHVLSFSTPVIELSLNKNNLLLAKQNSELKIKVALLEERMNIIKNELIESKFECNSLSEVNKQLEIQNKRLETMGRYGTRYFEKLGRSTELMIEKFKRSLELEHSFNSSQLSSTITPSLSLDSIVKRDNRELAVISEENFVPNSNENTPQVIKKQSRSRQLFTQSNPTVSGMLRDIQKVSSSVKKNKEATLDSLVLTKGINSICVSSNNLSDSKTDKENQDTPDVLSGKRVLRNGIRKNYVILPQNRKLRQGDKQFISVKPILNNNISCTPELQIYDLTD
ncbi:hypothetical protein LOD99_5628 [Oopsacas minuta]|uniref:Shugoshin C-terminal domain-containing protein n=1 Tax=Oopsacas minuta TaxID=111878 RepID=A0AAV7JQC6_9METZ|nr:hypothetical protein LOD99_5628 [Oopsacas minuta]